MEYLALVPAIFAIGILGFLLKRAHDQIDHILGIAATERAQLIAQVQRPDLSPTVAGPAEPYEESPYVPFDDDEAMADYTRAQRAGEAA